MNKKTLIDAAMGRTPCSLILKNAKIIDVLGRTIREGNIYIKDGYIVCVGAFDLSAERAVDLGGAYVSPSFIDAHVHIESSMLTPTGYSSAVIPKGTAAVIADPHEIANVCGSDGLDFMLRDKPLLKIHYMLPSCVPATPFDSSGAVLDGAECKRLWESGSFYGLGEMMNYPGVVHCDEDVIKKLSLTDKIDGHIPLISGRELQAYICGGINNDHECSSAEEALEKISLGLNIFIREGTGAKNLQELIKAVKPHNISHFAFCTDDKHIDDILREGTINHCISRAIALGMEPLDAFALGTCNPAAIYSLKGQGAIAPGYKADLVVMTKPDPAAENIISVYIDGSEYAGEKESPADISKVSSTVHIQKVRPEDLQPELSPHIPIISAREGSLITEGCYAENTEGLLMCANVERHRASGRIGKAYLKGFEIRGGAVAQTIGHDSHNITVLGDNTEDMALAVNALGEGRGSGGIAVAQGGCLKAFLPLEAAGLMSARPCAEVLEDYKGVEAAIKAISLGSAGSLLMILSFLSLLVIPHLKLSDRGLFNVDQFKFINKG